MRKALLTIDDSPSADTDELTSFLQANKVPAVFFCRGDRLKDNLEPMVRAAQRGFVVANHSFNHYRSSQITFEEAKKEILDTERLIEDVYKKAGVARSAKYFRFPQMDRGAGGWVVDYDAVPEYSATLKTLFADGLNIKLDPPTPEQIEKKRLLQEFLKAAGFIRLPSDDVTHKWFTDTEMADAVDAMFTFSTSDWMLTARHLGKWPYKSIEDLKQKIDDDPWLNTAGSANIILAHDQPEVLPTVKVLVTHMLQKGFTFTPI